MAQGHKILKTESLGHLVLLVLVTVGKSLNLSASIFWAVKYVKKAKFLSNKIPFLRVGTYYLINVIELNKYSWPLNTTEVEVAKIGAVKIYI